MKHRSISLLLGVFVGVLVVAIGEQPRQAFAEPTVPTLEVIRVIGSEPVGEPPPPPGAPPLTPREPDMTVKDLEQPVLDAELTPPPRRWILRDATWKSIAKSRYNLDFDLEPGHEYVGVRVVLPFGS